MELGAVELGKEHRANEKDFTRERKLDFRTVAILILQKSVKSLSCKLNEFFGHVEDGATAGAFTQARAKFNSEFFKNLNRRSYAEGWYSDGDYKRYKGYRLLAVDGTKIRLPDSSSVRNEFGTIKIKNQYEERDYTGGQGSVMYDVLNECVIDSEIVPSKTGEIELAKRHFEFCQSGDLVMFDRGYAGYLVFAIMVSQGIDFVCRCSKTAFKVVEEFLASDAKDRIITLTPCDDIRREVAEKGLPSSIQIRLVKVVLPNGEIEVLATSLLDKKKHPRSDFKNLYNMRWGIETFDARIKNNLSLENFSGRTAEAVKQDFYATMLIANIESELTGEIDDELENRTGDNKYQYKVSKTVSYNSIKDKLFELLMYSKDESDVLIKQIQDLFRKNTVPIRPERSAPRDFTPRRSLHYQKRLKKIVF